MRYLLLGLFAVVLVGCSSPSEVSYYSNISFSSTSSTFTHLDAGGIAIRSPRDTAVNFDLVPTVSVKNDSNIALPIFVQWEVYPITLDTIKHFLLDTVSLGTVPPGATIPLDSIATVTFSAADLAGAKLGISLTASNNLRMGPAVAIAETDIVPFDSRWRGILHTSESSTTIIDTIDGPDDGDWAENGILSMKPAVPNPSIGATTVQYSLPQPADSVRLVLAETPHHLLRSLAIGALQSGAYMQQLDLTGIAPGLYRVFLTVYKNGVASQSHGDIMIPLH